MFGPKSEKLSSAQIPLLLGEISLSASEVEQEAERPEAEKQNPLPRAKIPRPHHPGREKLPEHLERREELIPCCPEDCTCQKCGLELPVIGYETREELACEPAKFWVRVVKREKRGSHCLEEQGVVTAPAPAQIVPKGKLSNEFIIEVLAQKYQQHTPVYRQQAVLADNHGIELSRKTLTDALLAAGSLLRPVVEAQKAELFAGGYLQADETTMPCQTPEKTGRNHRAYMWQYSAPGGVVIFDFRMGRGRDGPAAFLKGFRGTLQSDGYGAYDDLGEGIVYAGCLSHARRGFVDAAKVAPLDPLPAEVIARLGELYAVEKQAREAGLKPEERRRLRQTRSVPVMAALKERLVAIRLVTRIRTGQHRLATAEGNCQPLAGRVGRPLERHPEQPAAQRNPACRPLEPRGHHGPGRGTYRKARHVGGSDGVGLHFLPQRGQPDSGQSRAGAGRRERALPGTSPRRVLRDLRMAVAEHALFHCVFDLKALTKCSSCHAVMKAGL